MSNLRTSKDRCNRCLLPHGFPGIKFNKEGLCSICVKTPSAEQLRKERDELSARLGEVLNSCRSSGSYDVIVAFSGGKDSSYTLKLLIENYDLRCLAITIDNGFLAKGTYRNIQSVCEALGVDHSLFSPNKKFTSKMYRLSVLTENIHAPSAAKRASAICSSCISLINTHMLQRAMELNVGVIAGGYIGGQVPKNGAMMRIAPGRQVRIRTAMVNKFEKVFGSESKPFFSLPIVEGKDHPEITVINPMLGLSVTEEEILETLKELGWKRPKDTGITSTNCRLNDLGVHLHTRQHGFHPYVLEIADQVRHGLVDKEKALAKLNKVPSRDQIQWLADKLQLPAHEY